MQLFIMAFPDSTNLNRMYTFDFFFAYFINIYYNIAKVFI